MKKRNLAIATITLVVVGGGAFYGGTIYEKKSLEEQGLLRNANMQPGNKTSGKERSNRTADGLNRKGENSEIVIGEIMSKDEKSVTVKTRDGGSKIIYLSDSTKIGEITSGSLADLESGKQVVINGKANQDGSFSAQDIQIRQMQ